jgi:meso-butanediol dehydrogenase / (S,S)-butanediol dehydrogenase / diacetyl reductase
VLTREGASVAILDVNAQDRAFRVDVTDEYAVQTAIAEVTSRWGAVDILVNCAGIALRKTVDQTEQSDWVRIFDVNVKGTFLAAKAALPHMRDDGSIVNLSSITGITGLRERAAYSASKGAIAALTRNMALDYAPRGIRVNCVCPGFVRTPMTDALTRDPEANRRLTSVHPLGRLGEPADIANAILFLVSDEASWITGHLLVVDGGFSAGQPAV